MSTMDPSEFILPDFFATCPFAFGRTNPHADVVIPEAHAWIVKHVPFVDRKRDEFIQDGFQDLMPHCYPWAGKETLRTMCYLNNLLFLVDDLTDDMNSDEARGFGESFIRVLNDPAVHDSSQVMQATREFRSRITGTGVTESRWFGRFLAIFKLYINAVCAEAEDRENKRILDLDTFTVARRENSAVMVFFAITEYALGIDLPDAVYEDPTFLRVYADSADMVILVNDVFSYNREQAKGLDGNNNITVLMQTLDLDLQAAVDHVGEMFSQKMEGCMRGRAMLPSWGVKVDADVERFFDALDQWVVGNLEWSSQSPRYLGPEHEEIMRTRRVVLRKVETEIE
ncbi:terpenoid synthase [Coniophora puteana RWD-64-598 SS2]|uniref:Terpene synthase n=1 Tax=Coniophora puteana (strain RWD-64-598) TaxID=741705 RepID=A0A5M3MFC0_CONPW|nr:terpenoid synthase [Coniophora puteana RWD-64-598 SS2]EIW77853.1 terpenoid synthase [Coniophora puteana RWD-64-598 SS2]